MQDVVNRTTMIFDGTCVLCNRSVAFILAHETDDMIEFVAVRSGRGRALAQEYGFSDLDLDRSFVVIENGRPYLRSEAAFIIAKYLKAPYRWLGVLRVFPKALRDTVYMIIARNRYRWFGQQEQCFLLPVSHRERFWDDHTSIGDR